MRNKYGTLYVHLLSWVSRQKLILGYLSGLPHGTAPSFSLTTVSRLPLTLDHPMWLGVPISMLMIGRRTRPFGVLEAHSPIVLRLYWVNLRSILDTKYGWHILGQLISQTTDKELEQLLAATFYCVQLCVQSVSPWPNRHLCLFHSATDAAKSGGLNYLRVSLGASDFSASGAYSTTTYSHYCTLTLYLNSLQLRWYSKRYFSLTLWYQSCPLIFIPDNTGYSIYQCSCPRSSSSLVSCAYSEFLVDHLDFLSIYANCVAAGLDEG
jgi:hypothetical protein